MKFLDLNDDVKIIIAEQVIISLVRCQWCYIGSTCFSLEKCLYNFKLKIKSSLHLTAYLYMKRMQVVEWDTAYINISLRGGGDWVPMTDISLLTNGSISMYLNVHWLLRMYPSFPPPLLLENVCISMYIGLWECRVNEIQSFYWYIIKNYWIFTNFNLIVGSAPRAGGAFPTIKVVGMDLS